MARRTIEEEHDGQREVSRLRWLMQRRMSSCIVPTHFAPQKTQAVTWRCRIAVAAKKSARGCSGGDVCSEHKYTVDRPTSTGKTVETLLHLESEIKNEVSSCLCLPLSKDEAPTRNAVYLPLRQTFPPFYHLQHSFFMPPLLKLPLACPRLIPTVDQVKVTAKQEEDGARSSSYGAPLQNRLHI